MNIFRKIYTEITDFIFKKQEIKYNNDSVVRISELVTNSVIPSNPCDNETFNRIIADLENITVACLSTKLKTNSDEFSYHYAKKTLDDIENWLRYLCVIYKQKKTELEVLTNFINLLDLTKRLI